MRNGSLASRWSIVARLSDPPGEAVLNENNFTTSTYIEYKRPKIGIALRGAGARWAPLPSGRSTDRAALRVVQSPRQSPICLAYDPPFAGSGVPIRLPAFQPGQVFRHRFQFHRRVRRAGERDKRGDLRRFPFHFQLFPGKAIVPFHPLDAEERETLSFPPRFFYLKKMIP